MRRDGDFAAFSTWTHRHNGAIVASARCEISGRVVRSVGVAGAPIGSELDAARALSLTLTWERSGRPST